MFWSIPNTCLPASSSFWMGKQSAWGTTHIVQCPAETLLLPKVQQSQPLSCPQLSHKPPQWQVFAPCASLPAIHLPSSLLHWQMSRFYALDGPGSCSLSSLPWPEGLGFPLGKWNADMPPTALSLSPLSSALTRREHFHISCRLWSQSAFQVTQSQQQGEQGGKTKAW